MTKIFSGLSCKSVHILHALWIQGEFHILLNNIVMC